MMSGNSKKAYNTLKALTKTQQHKSAVIEDGSGNIMMESTAVLNWWTTMNSILTLKKKKNLKQSWLPVFWKKDPQSTEKVEKNTF